MRTWIKAVVGSLLVAASSSQADQDFQPLVDAFKSLGWSYWPITPWTWELHQTLRDPPVWVDFSQLPPEFAKRWDTSKSQLYGVKVLSVSLWRDISTCKVLVTPGDSLEQLAVVDSTTQPQLKLQLDEDKLILQQWRKWLETQDLAIMVDWYGPMHPPDMVLHTPLADIRDRGLYEKNVAIAEAEAERAARARAESARQATEERKARSQMLMMMGQGGYSVTNELQPFSIFSIQNDTNGWMTVHWESASTHLYEVQAASEMTWTTAWQNVAIMIGGDGNSSWTDTNASSFNHRFYRVRRLTFAGDEDGDGVSNIDEFYLGTNLRSMDTDSDGIPDGQDPNPLDPNIGPPTGAAVSLYNAYGIYTNGMTNIYLQADARSTNAAVTVVAAEYFHSIVSSNGGGIAMGALDGTFSSTNETVAATFTPSFPHGERHILWLHAQGSDGQWGDFVKVIINPNVNDILDKVRENYSKIQTISYTFTAKKILEGEVLQTQTVRFKQKGPYKMRWENQTTGETTILNHNEIAFIDANGRITPMFLVVNDDASADSSKESYMFWDVDRFISQHNLGSASSLTNGPASYRISATPKTPSTKPYDSIGCEVDCRFGVVTLIEQTKDSSVVFRTEQPQAQEITPGLWFQSQQNWSIPVDANWDLRHNAELQMQTIQINGVIPDEEFDF